MRTNRFFGYRRFDQRPWLEKLEDRLVLASLAALGDLSQNLNSMPADVSVAASAEAEASSIEQSDAGRASQAVNNFAFDLYRHFQREQGNLFLSPLSISMALAMTYAGARGSTADEMANVLHLGSDPGIHESYRELFESLTTGDRPFELAIANALWPQIGYPFKEEFMQLIATDYGSSSQSLDYLSDPDAARDVINSWVQGQTNDKIKDLIKKLEKDTRMVLTNAIYFKGAWATEFDSARTRSRPFHLDSGETVDVPMMNLNARFRYHVQDGFQMLEMPYKGDKLSMVLLLPEAGNTDAELSADTLAKASSWLDSAPFKRDVNVNLPKFKTTVSSGLNEVLKGMGMPTAFDRWNADFRGMFRPSGENLYVSEVLHKGFVEVNEEGTEAAAATAVIVVGLGCFAAGTPVLTPEGETRIELLQPGDRVLSRDEKNLEGKIEPQVIEETFQRRSELVNLHVAGRVIRTTKEHPFFVKGRGWTTAGELNAKDLLATDRDRFVEVEKVDATGQMETVYNLRVANHHTYFVGSKAWGFAVWAHNSYYAVPEQFNADHPFHFFIRDNATSTILFMGRVSDPLQEENELAPTANEPEQAALTQVPPATSPLDENQDGQVTPLDILMIINHINASTTAAAAFSAAESSPFDNNGDGVVSAGDVLMLVNWFNVQAGVYSMSPVDDSDSNENDQALLALQDDDAGSLWDGELVGPQE